MLFYKVTLALFPLRQMGTFNPLNLSGLVTGLTEQRHRSGPCDFWVYVRKGDAASAWFSGGSLVPRKKSTWRCCVGEDTQFLQPSARRFPTPQPAPPPAPPGSWPPKSHLPKTAAPADSWALPKVLLTQLSTKWRAVVRQCGVIRYAATETRAPTILGQVSKIKTILSGYVSQISELKYLEANSVQDKYLKTQEEFR